MSRTSWIVLSLLACVGSVWPNAAEAQVIYHPRHRHWDSRSINRQLDAAENALESAVKAQRELAPKVVEAHAKAVEHDRDFKEVMAQARAEHDRDPQLMKARAEYTKAQSEFDDSKAHVLRLLKDSAAYVAALEQRALAAEALRAASRSDTESRQQAAKKSAQAMSEVTRLENEAIEADSTAAAAHRRQHETSDRVAELIAKCDRDFATDPRVSSAKLGRQRTREEFQLLQQQMAAINAGVAQAERVYQSMVQQQLAWEQYERAQHWGGGYWPYWHRGRTW